MATVRLSLVLTLVGVYLLFWLGLRHDDLPSHNTARRQRHDPNSNYGGSHGAGRHHRHHKDNLNPPASPVLAAVADAAAAAPRVRRWADQDYPPPPPRVVEQAHEAEMGVENVQDDVVGVDDVGALDASGMEEGSVEPEVVAEEEELQGAEEEEGVPEADELAQPQPIDVVQQVAEAEEKQAATDGVRSVVEGEELVVWTEEEGEEEADEGVAERWMEHMPEDRVAAAATARARAASRRPVTRGGRQPPPTVVGPPPPSPPPLPPGQCFPIMGDAGATGLPAQLELLQSRGVNDYVNDSLTLSSAAALANLQAPDECTLVGTPASLMEETTALGSCAIVFPTRHLLGAGAGDAIDAHDTVIRINGHNAPRRLSRDARDLGTRTELRTVTVALIAQGSPKHTIHWSPQEIWVLFSACSHARPEPWCLKLRDLLGSYRPVRALDFVPDPAHRAGRCLDGVKRAWKGNDHRYHAKPTTGFVTALYAAQQCSCVTVFGLCNTLSCDRALEWAGHSDRSGWKDMAHDFTLEHLAIVLMAKSSPQNLRLWVSTGGVTAPLQSPPPSPPPSPPSPPPSPPSPPPHGGALAFLSSLKARPSTAKAAALSLIKPRLAARVHDPRAHRPRVKGLHYAEDAEDKDYSAEGSQDPAERGMGFGQVRDGHTGEGLDDE